MKKLIILPIIIGLAFASCNAEMNDKENKKNEYEPNLASLRDHESPEWFHDLKFGMFIDYGLWSVPGWAPKKEEGAMYPDWYLWRMYTDEDFIEYHNKTWGDDFERDDFIPMFTSEDWDPEALVNLAIESGMKYVIPFAKHMDGYCLWPSSYTNRDAVDMTPHEDLIGPLVEECREKGLKFGFYYCIEEWEYPIIGEDDEKLMRKWPQIEIESHDEEKYEGRITGKIPVNER